MAWACERSRLRPYDEAWHGRKGSATGGLRLQGEDDFGLEAFVVEARLVGLRRVVD
jgi:hypothetical protein